MQISFHSTTLTLSVGLASCGMQKCTNSYLFCFYTVGSIGLLAPCVCKLTTILLRSIVLSSIFIVRLNLDFGVEACFYNGLDAYSKTWLFFSNMLGTSKTQLDQLGAHKSLKICQATKLYLSWQHLIATAHFTHLEYPTKWLYIANFFSHFF